MKDTQDKKPGLVVSGWLVFTVGAILFAFALGLLAMAVWFGSRPLEGELVLTRTGCQALEHHGASVRHWDNGSGCTLKTRFRMNSRAQHARIFVQTDKGPSEVVLAAREVISHAYR